MTDRERLEEIKNNITSNEVDSVKLHVADFVRLIYQAELGIIQQEQFHDMQKSIMKLQERVQELESFKNSVEYTVDTETIELIVENQDSDVALSSVETYDEEIFFLKKRVEELIKAHELKELEHQGLISQLKEKDKQNKRYREELDILGEVINSAPNADKLNEEYERLKGLEGEE